MRSSSRIAHHRAVRRCRWYSSLALWGTVLPVLGYGTIWLGIARLYRAESPNRRGPAVLGHLLLCYGACECAYFTWYARDYWPPYHAYLRLQLQPGAPDFQRPLPLNPQPDWPAYRQSLALRSRPEWPALRKRLPLTVSPLLPEMWPWLKYAFSGLKLLFTLLLVALIWRRPDESDRARVPDARQ